MRTEVKPLVQEALLLPFFERMSDEDKQDLEHGWGAKAFNVLMQSFYLSEECYGIFADDEMIGIFGVTEENIVWMMRTEKFEKVAIRFIRQFDKYFNMLIEGRGEVTGYLSKRYTKFIRFLEWNAFRMTDLGNGYYKVEGGCLSSEQQ